MLYGEVHKLQLLPTLYAHLRLAPAEPDSKPVSAKRGYTKLRLDIVILSGYIFKKTGAFRISMPITIGITNL